MARPPRLAWTACALALLAPHALAQTADICASAAFQALSATALGASPLRIRSLVQGKAVCIELELAESAVGASQGWFAVGLAQSNAMVNSPVTNCMVYQRSIGAPESFVLGEYSQSGVAKEANQSFFTIAQTSTAPLRFSYQRQLAAQSQYDVSIDLTVAARFIWAYGRSWPINGHASGTVGSESYDFSTGASASASPSFCDGKNCSAILGGIALAVMMLGGVVLTTIGARTGVAHVLLHKTFAAPPVKATTNAPIAKPWTSARQIIADLRIGEALVILVFIAAVVLLVVLSGNVSSGAITGKIALLVMMFLILPISKVPLWSALFGSSFERIVKFHRWLGMLLVIAVLVHLIIVLDSTSVVSMDKFGNAVPLWGLLGFITFVLLGMTAMEYVRRMLFEVFYISHRILSIAAFVYTILHSPKTIGIALAVPLGFYVIGLLDQWRRSYLTKYQATVIVNEAVGTTTLMLTPTAQLAHFARHMNLCSFFWVRIPSISSYEWHPFSAIVTRDGDSLGFCIRSMGKSKAFTQRLFEHGKKMHSVALNLCGPFGKIGVDVTQYEVVVMIAGGVGITPLLSAINQRKLLDSLRGVKAEWHILWSVRSPTDLLMIERFLALQSEESQGVQDSRHSVDADKSGVSITWHCHCSNETSDGAMQRTDGGDAIRYRGGMPVLDEYINTSRWHGRRVAVLSCGPPTMTVNAQALAKQCGFDFHKEVFGW